MDIHSLHSWDLTPTEAVALQKELAGRGDARAPLTACELVAGADVSYNRFSPIFYAALGVRRASDGGIGDALRTKHAIKPLYVSVGHKIDLASAVKLTLLCCRGYRLPEPTRQAHLHVNVLRRNAMG